MSDSVRPQRRQPTRLPRPWDSPGKNLGVGCHFLLQCMKVKSEREVAQLYQLFATPWTAAYQAPLSMGFSRQQYWSGVPSPSPIYLPIYIYTNLLFFRFCSLIGYYKILNIVPCAIQQVLVVYQFIYGCVYTLIPTFYFFLFPLCPLVTIAMSVSLFLFYK